MMRVGSSLLSSALFVCSASTPALAQHMNASGVSCNQPSSTVEEAACFARSSDAADKELNSLYAKVRSVLSTEERNDLLEAQRAWLKYRDLDLYRRVQALWRRNWRSSDSNGMSGGDNGGKSGHAQDHVWVAFRKVASDRCGNWHLRPWPPFRSNHRGLGQNEDNRRSFATLRMRPRRANRRRVATMPGCCCSCWKRSAFLGSPPQQAKIGLAGAPGSGCRTRPRVTCGNC